MIKRVFCILLVSTFLIVSGCKKCETCTTTIVEVPKPCRPKIPEFPVVNLPEKNDNGDFVFSEDEYRALTLLITVMYNFITETEENCPELQD